MRCTSCSSGQVPCFAVQRAVAVEALTRRYRHGWNKAYKRSHRQESHTCLRMDTRPTVQPNRSPFLVTGNSATRLVMNDTCTAVRSTASDAQTASVTQAGQSFLPELLMHELKKKVEQGLLASACWQGVIATGGDCGCRYGSQGSGGLPGNGGQMVAHITAGDPEQEGVSIAPLPLQCSGLWWCMGKLVHARCVNDGNWDLQHSHDAHGEVWQYP